MLVENGHGLVGDVVVRGDSSQICDLEISTLPVVLDQAVFIQQTGSGVYKVKPPLVQKFVCFIFVNLQKRSQNFNKIKKKEREKKGGFVLRFHIEEGFATCKCIDKCNPAS